MAAPGPLDSLIGLLARLPGLGPRSARRAALFLLKRREELLVPLAEALHRASEDVRACSCGNLDVGDPCGICADPRRDPGLVCVVEEVADLWALERAQVFRGRYHVIGGVLSALDGTAPEDLNLAALERRARGGEVREVILATNATVEGQTTAHYIADALAEAGVAVSRIAHGLPMGGELDYMDEGTLGWALKSRLPLSR